MLWYLTISVLPWLVWMFTMFTAEVGQIIPPGQNLELQCLLPDAPHSVSWKFVPADARLADKSPYSSRLEVGPARITPHCVGSYVWQHNFYVKKYYIIIWCDYNCKIKYGVGQRLIKEVEIGMFTQIGKAEGRQLLRLILQVSFLYL